MDNQMTKEPIMIDDKYWEKKYADMHIRLTNENSELREQLKRKEQECEGLKKQLTILDDEDVVVEITVKQFEEYKKLKQVLQEIKEIAKDYANNDWTGLAIKFEQILQKCEELDIEAQNLFTEKKNLEAELDQLKAENNELKEKVNSYICSTNCYKHKENDKYRQALQEIKEIAKKG